MFLRFNEVRSSGEKQHDVVVVFVPPALVVAVVVLWLWIVSGGGGSRGQGEQRGGRNFLQEQRIISPPIHFLPLSTLPAPSLYLLVESLDEAPNQPSFANIFF
jgi:hypothetical protein